MGIFKKMVKEAETLDLELDTFNASKEKKKSGFGLRVSKELIKTCKDRIIFSMN